MKYLKKINSNSSVTKNKNLLLYNTDTNESIVYQESYVIITYDVTSTESPTNILGNPQVSTWEGLEPFKNLSAILEMYVDNEKTSTTPSLTYTFDSIGTHTIKFIIDNDITDCNNMFCGGETYNLPIINIDLSHFNTSKVTNMHAMFWGLPMLTSLDVTKLKTSNVTNMYGMLKK